MQQKDAPRVLNFPSIKTRQLVRFPVTESATDSSLIITEIKGNAHATGDLFTTISHGTRVVICPFDDWNDAERH